MKARSIKYLIVIVLFLIPVDTSAETVNVFSYPTSGSSLHYYHIPYSGHFVAANGTHFDASQYYQRTGTELNVSGVTAFFLADDFSVKLNWTADLGYRSKLYQVSPSILGGVSLIKSYKTTKFEFSLKNLFFLGGKVREWPCVDELQREFHCGTGLPWSDYSQHLINPEMGIQMAWTKYF